MFAASTHPSLLPILWHWLRLLERSAQSDLGPDGSNSLRAAGVVTHGSPQFRGDDLADAAATVAALSWAGENKRGRSA
jgi:hypothetical protein